MSYLCHSYIRKYKIHLKDITRPWVFLCVPQLQIAMLIWPRPWPGGLTMHTHRLNWALEFSWTQETRAGAAQILSQTAWISLLTSAELLQSYLKPIGWRQVQYRAQWLRRRILAPRFSRKDCKNGIDARFELLCYQNYFPPRFAWGHPVSWPYSLTRLGALALSQMCRLHLHSLPLE